MVLWTPFSTSASLATTATISSFGFMLKYFAKQHIHIYHMSPQSLWHVNTQPADCIAGPQAWSPSDSKFDMAFITYILFLSLKEYVHPYVH